MRKNWIIALFLALCFCKSYSQKTDAPNNNKEFRINFNDNGTNYVRLTFLNQVWLRCNESNPGTTVFDTSKSKTFDIGLRRTRIQLYGKLSERIFIYTQIGQNNLSYLSPRKQGIYFLDAVSEYEAFTGSLSFGAGLGGWNGVSRFSSPSVGSILGMDAPLFQQATHDVNDQFLRKLSIYAKGKLGKLDYRLILSDPMAIQSGVSSSVGLSSNSSFSSLPPKAQMHGYFNYQFLEQESNLTPYMAGTYLGKKQLINLGAGFLVQPKAMWRQGSNMDTIFSDLILASLDVFIEKSINLEKGTSFNLYASIYNSNFGSNYIRNVGPMNPANGLNANGSFNGIGNALPMVGTGNTFYFQTGYLMPKKLLNERGVLQPYVGIQYSDFQAIKDKMRLLDVGINWLIDDQRAKISFNYQKRPVFMSNSIGEIRKISYKGAYVIQYQLSF